MPGTPHDAGPMLKSCGTSSKSTSTADQLAARRGVEPAPARLHEEVEQVVLAAGRVGEQEAAGAERRQRALGRERGEHRADGGVERVAAVAERLRAGLGGHVVARGDYAFHRRQRRAWV